MHTAPDPVRVAAARPAPAPAPRPNRARRFAIASGKGGVGKTWLGITLAHAWSRHGGQVLLMDGDLGLANIDIQLGLMPPHDLGAVIAGRIPLARAPFRFAPGNFDILAGPSGSGSLAALDPALLEELLAGIAALRYHTILADLGAGLEPSVRRLASWADTLLVIATDEPTSLTDAYAVLKLHARDRPGGDARVVINQATSRVAGERTYLTLARACKNFLGASPPLAGVIRRDDRVRDAIRRQTPLLTRHPTCLAAEDVDRLARGLEG